MTLEPGIVFALDKHNNFFSTISVNLEALNEIKNSWGPLPGQVWLARSVVLKRHETVVRTCQLAH